MSWTADTDGSFTDVSTDVRVNGSVKSIIAVNGSPTPTNLYDIYIKDGNGLDILDGSGEDIDSSLDAVGFKPDFCLDSALTLSIENNSVNGAKGEVIIYVIEL